MKDGDVLQLGVDYQGGAEDIYKSVKIKIELGREWQAGANAFNTNTLKILKSLQLPTVSKSHPPTHPALAAPSSAAAGPSISTSNPATTKPHSHSQSPSQSQIPDCRICLFAVTIRQALFIAPCSHTFHYKCIRPLLEAHHPAFSCPLCRTFADLEEDVEVEVEVDMDAGEEGEGEIDWEAEGGAGSGAEGGAGSGVEGGGGPVAGAGGGAPPTDPLIAPAPTTDAPAPAPTSAPPGPAAPATEHDDTQMPPIEVDAEPESEPDVGGSGIRANSASPQLVDELGIVAAGGVGGMDVDGATVGPGGAKGKGVAVVSLA
ncbi:hypothetical protein H0H92_007887 [Tricholoma furcatifolium]|nr:hypothetical protein H0H92_007887 [Tricholoma furcatifolium]